MMMQPVYQYVPSGTAGYNNQSRVQKGSNGGIHAKMRQTKQNVMKARANPSIESRVLLRNGRTVNSMQGQQQQQKSIEQRVRGPIRTSPSPAPQQQQS